MAADSVAAALAEVFARNFRHDHDLGASLSVWRGGEEWVCLAQGWREREHRNRWNRDTLVPVYSATKGPAAATLLVALESRGLGPETPVREVWPAFPVAADFGQLLSHQCGLAALDAGPSIWDHAACVAAVEAQRPLWPLGTGHGYHPRSFGALVEEPVRRLTGMTLGAWWRERIAAPLGLEFWIGLPAEQFSRVAHVYPGKAPDAAGQELFREAFASKATLTHRAFHSLAGLHAVREMNSARAWAAGLPAMGGVGTATALARFYQAAIGALPGPLSERVRRWLAEPRVAGPDRVLLCDTVFTCGCQRDPLDAGGGKTRSLFGPSAEAFGHSGAGGSHAFGDPRTGWSFAYVMNRMEAGLLPGPRCRDLVAALLPSYFLP